jgi:sterol desaturase/sphingolipid hydroxylase (fatty acid hydroxylase superfamily)
MGRVAGIVVALAVLGVVFGLLEWRWAARPDQKRLRPGFGTDLVYWFFTPVGTRAIGQLAVALGVGLVAVAMGAPLSVAGVKQHLARPTWFTTQPLALQVVLGLLLADFFGYWSHRAFHTGGLWRFHAVHHSSRQLDWLSAARVHPLNDVLGKLLTVLPLVVLGLRPGAVAAVLPVTVLYAVMLHANVRWTYGPLRFVLASPAFHRWHHTAEARGMNTNFAGLFPVWDLCFGTFHMPRDARGQLAQPEVFGVEASGSGREVPDGFWGQLAYPFRGGGAPPSRRT